MGYYKNSFKNNNSYESNELTNLKGWIILGGLSLTSLFVILYVFLTPGPHEAFLVINITMLIGGYLLSMMCDAYLLGRLLLALGVFLSIVAALITLSTFRSYLNLFYALFLTSYFAGLFPLIWKLHMAKRREAGSG